MLDEGLLDLVRDRRGLLAGVLLLQVGGLLANLSVTAGVYWALYQVMEEQAAQLWQPLLLLAAGTAARFGFTVWTGAVRTRLGSGVKRALRRRAYDKLLRLGVTQHYGICPGEYLPELKDLAMMLDMEFAQV